MSLLVSSFALSPGYVTYKHEFRGHGDMGRGGKRVQRARGTGRKSDHFTAP